MVDQAVRPVKVHVAYSDVCDDPGLEQSLGAALKLLARSSGQRARKLASRHHIAAQPATEDVLAPTHVEPVARSLSHVVQLLLITGYGLPLGPDTIRTQTDVAVADADDVAVVADAVAADVVVDVAVAAAAAVAVYVVVVVGVAVAAMFAAVAAVVAAAVVDGAAPAAVCG